MDTKNGASENGETRAVVSQNESADGAALSNQLPNSRKVYVSGKIHPDIRVPFREITLAPTKSINGTIEVNEPVRVYDTSGPWGDPHFHGDVPQGRPPWRAKWIRDRDVETIAGRAITPADNGYFSQTHAEHVVTRNGSSKSRALGSRQTPKFNLQDPNFARRKVLRAKPHAVTEFY